MLLMGPYCFLVFRHFLQYVTIFFWSDTILATLSALILSNPCVTLESTLAQSKVFSWTYKANHHSLFLIICITQHTICGTFRYRCIPYRRHRHMKRPYLKCIRTSYLLSFSFYGMRSWFSLPIFGKFWWECARAAMFIFSPFYLLWTLTKHLPF